MKYLTLILCFVGNAVYAADGLKVCSIKTESDPKEGFVTDVKVRVAQGYSFTGAAYYELRFVGSIDRIAVDEHKFIGIVANSNKSLLGWNLHLGSNINEIILIAREVNGDVKIFHSASDELAGFFGGRKLDPERMLLMGFHGNRINIYYDPIGGHEKRFDFDAEIRDGKLRLCPGSVQEDD